MTAAETSACAACGAGNRAGRRFCAQCGAVLTVSCAACGFGNEPAERFCGGCGAALAGASSTATSAPVAPGEAERRTVTVLFADLCGYTRLSQGLDAEDVHRLLERYFGVVDAIVDRFGGRVDKHIGDAVMALFGAPVAHGDEPSRAVRAADAIQRAMPDIGMPFGRALTVHIGIAAGEVVASGVGAGEHRAYTVVGPSVNLASRLVGVAGPGEIVLDGAVHDAIAREAVCTPLPALSIKGLDRLVDAWRLDALGGNGDAGATPPFVGRAAELAQLSALVRACVGGGTGTIIHVRGDPGIGKSRLVGELTRIAMAEGFACHTGLVLDFGTAKGRDPVRDIVASLVGLAPASAADERARALDAAAGTGTIDVDARPAFADLLDLPAPDGSRELYAAMDNAARQRARTGVLVRLAAAASRARPLLITVEDLHWADKATLGYVAELARAVTKMRAVLVLTSRVDGDPLAGGFRASLAGVPLVTLDLAPLSDADAVALAAGLVAGSARLAQKCIERAGGNPLFLEQLLRTADDSEDRLPASLASLVLARVDRLHERDRAALRAAAVIGQRFPLALLRHLIATPDYDCAALLAASLVRPDGEEFLFAHALIRDGVYGSLTRPRRAELHRAAAAWYGERDPTLRAEHFDRAEAPEAPQAYLGAARAQSEALHLERALALAERGAALAREAADVYALNLQCGRLRCDAGEGAPAVEAFTRALAATSDPVERCRALLGLAAGHRLIANVDEALAMLADAEPIATSHGLTRELAELHATRGNVQFARGDNAACRAAHEAGAVHARALGDPALIARAVSGLADAYYATSRMRTALARFDECVALCEAHGLVRIAIPNLVMGGFCRMYMNEFDAGIEKMRAGHALACRVGDRHAEMFGLEARGVLLVFRGHYEEAEPVCTRALALAESLGARRYQALLLCVLAETRFVHGDLEGARERNVRALALARDTAMPFCGPLVLALEARMLEAGPERERCRDEVLTMLRQGSLGHSQIGFHRLGIDDALARGEWGRVREHVDTLDAFTRDERLPYVDFLIARGRALAALGENPADRIAYAELERLKREAARIDWRMSWPTLAGA
ncbi:MAG TPA: adenylate/guanylate cyclase domain-containing protein [Casimicrobiaceae bacterium]|nr:adenylate/guanylate cyclase domain-containing protein [Casimicrobiaceae bacterium]